jgi:hypothetical protein
MNSIIIYLFILWLYFVIKSYEYKFKDYIGNKFNRMRRISYGTMISFLFLEVFSISDILRVLLSFIFPILILVIILGFIYSFLGFVVLFRETNTVRLIKKTVINEIISLVVLPVGIFTLTLKPKYRVTAVDNGTTLI